MSRIVKCPACGADVTFNLGDSIVVVCSYCRSAVARGDRTVEQLGKLADLAETGTLLELGLAGRFEDAPFTIVGRAQLLHAAGGRWDEWYLRFSDGRWGWLADAEGRYSLTFADAAAEPPPLAALAVGSDWDGLSVVEKNTARTASAGGELPYAPRPDESFDFIDLAGPGGLFATIDYGETPPRAYRGREVTLADLGLAARAKLTREAPRAAPGVELRCPQCGGPIALRLPDQSKRVVCPSCGSLLDASRGALQYLEALLAPPRKPLLAPGSKGTLRGVAYTVLGALERYVVADGKSWPWMEYLLHEPKAGFRWLVEAQGHFSLVQPIPRGAPVSDGTGVRFGDRRFHRFQAGEAVVGWVVGEFYWEVRAGETVETVDFVSPPLMLSHELSGTEAQWSIGDYLPAGEVAKAFSVEPPPQKGVAPHQLNLNGWRSRRFLGFLVALVAAVLAIAVTRENRPLLKQAYPELCRPPPLPSSPRPTAAAPTNAGPPAAEAAPPDEPQPPSVFTEPFELHARQDVTIDVAAPVDNSWIYLAGDLVNDDTGLVQSFEVPVEYYHGYEDGESWSEGAKSRRVRLPAQPPGHYTMRLECQIDPAGPRVVPINVGVHNGVFDVSQMLIALGLLMGWWGLLFVRGRRFEQRRWSETDLPMPKGFFPS